MNERKNTIFINRVFKENTLKQIAVIFAAIFLCVSMSYMFAQEATSSEYKIGPKDVLEISVAGWDEVSKTVRVTEEGKITLPYLGEIDVEGLTQAELEKRLSDLLEKDYLQNPQVTVFISKFLSKIVYVDGAVGEEAVSCSGCGLQPRHRRQSHAGGGGCR